MLDYYVYELIDSTNPNQLKVFYVGKGIGARIKDHAKKVLAKISANEEIKDPKELVLKQLLTSTNTSPDCLKELVIGRYATEDEAFAVESTLIKWVYGHENLTNIVHGHRADQIREKGNYDFDSELQPLAYLKQRVHNIESRGIVERAQNLATSLGAIGFMNIHAGWQGQDYGLFWPVPNFPVVVQLKMQENNNKVVMNARPSLQSLKALGLEKPDRDSKEANFNAYVDLLTRAGYAISFATSSDKAFAALFESLVKSGKNWNDKLQKKIKDITGQSIQMRTSNYHGIESSNIEAIGGYLRDLEIRLTIASCLDSELNQGQEITAHLINLIKFFQSKPANKYFPNTGAGKEDFLE